MLDMDGLNWFAVIVAWLIFSLIGAFWYSPVGFGKQWSAMTGIDIMNLPGNEANAALGFVAISAMVQAIALGILANSVGADSFADGLVLGLVVSIGLTVATTVGTTLYQRRSWGFWLINGSYFVVAMTINAILFTIW